MPEPEAPQDIFEALPIALREEARKAADDAFMEGRLPVVVHPENLALAQQVRCAHEGCPRWAELGDIRQRCPQHKLGVTKGSHLYDKALANAPSLAQIQESIRESGSANELEDDIVLIRALTHKYVESNASLLELGDPAAILMATELINKASILIDRQVGRKYSVTLTGVNAIIQQVISILELHLSPQPDVLRKIALDIAKIKMPMGSLSK